MLSAQFVKLNLTGPLFFQLKMSHGVMSSDTFRVAGETPIEADLFIGRLKGAVGSLWSSEGMVTTWKACLTVTLSTINFTEVPGVYWFCF